MTAFDPSKASKNITDDYVSYLTTAFHIADPVYNNALKEALHEKDSTAKGPFLEISDSYKTGKTLEELIEAGEASPLFRILEGDVPDKDKELQLNRRLYLHQETSLIKTNRGRNLIITTGTGSGKTECFMIPIINHLLKEAEEGTLSSGVRAILIYPMNALANDQMKRLRKLLREFPQITFGVYNSSTKDKETAGVQEYGRIFKDEKGIPLRPLENELVSREQMRNTPPNILVTNYAMLEYMMLRPKDDLVFSSANLRFLVLDEAHIYRGATGMETALLLKRLKARISDSNKVIHILTSATLGDVNANPEIVHFGKTLCTADFAPEDIVRSEPVVPSYSNSAKDLPCSLFAELSEPNRPLNDIVQSYGIQIPDGMKDEEFLYDLCVDASAYRKLREAVKTPMTVQDIAEAVKTDGFTEKDIINIVRVASQAVKRHSPLIKARYHYFVKATEGLYITIGEHKELSLKRKQFSNKGNTQWKYFEAAICDDCGRIAVVGQLKEGRLEFPTNQLDNNTEYYLLSEKEEKFEEENEEQGIQENEYLLCAKCGSLIHASLLGKTGCNCGAENYVRVIHARKTKTNGDGVCPGCGFGTLKMFYVGYNAATAVVATSLYEELPETEKVLKSKPVQQKKGLFGGAVKMRSADLVKRKRQFLSFSDSRGDAAFFASYMTSYYREFQRRRGMVHVAKKNADNMIRNPWGIEQFVEELTAFFDSERAFAEPGDTGKENLTAVSRKNAWIAILNEMVNARRTTSLTSLGFIRFEYKGNAKDMMSGVAQEYGKNLEDVKALFDILAMDIVLNGAIEGACNLTNDEREYIFFGIKPRRFKKVKDPVRDKKKVGLYGWSAMPRANGSLIMNSRVRRVMRALNVDEMEANNILQMYWDEVLVGGQHNLTPDGDGGYYFKTDMFTVSTCNEDVPMYKCNVCGKTTVINCQDSCITVKCRGRLERISHNDITANNHYARLYQSTKMEPLHIKEHTAQLGREEQQKYQEMFINKDINALSCSTTFEMGVDVGDLETVYLRNMPPSPSNYVQRAGRAGRSVNAAAFSVTFVKLSSHDYSYYNDPVRMISGKIGVPVFSLENEKVTLRHIFAVALSDFFAAHPECYNSNNADVMLNQDGWEKLKKYLSEKPAHLREMLKKSIPEVMHDVMGINDYSWTERLIGDDGVMTVAVNDFRNTVNYYEQEYNKLKRKGQTIEAATALRKLQLFRKGKDDKAYYNELIEFLARNNVLPKYGFPVDTVELFQNTSSKIDTKLQMTRDLQLGISEYAPDSEVVADGNLYRSRYIRKLPGKSGQEWDTVYIAKCGDSQCVTWNLRYFKPETEEKCVSCGGSIKKTSWKKAIEPRKGFIADAVVKAVPMRKPEKKYRSDDYYLGDHQRQIIQKYSFTTKNGDVIQLETSVNDSLMVVCNDVFFVCHSCGYAESASENVAADDHFNWNQRGIKKSHRTPWGKPCETEMHRTSLCHVFKTDVVKIMFCTVAAGDLSVMLSVLYALLEGLSSVMDIERNDIRGCLHKVKYEGQMINTIVLYDAVPGGAGHVRRMVTEDGEAFQKVIEEAIAITKRCTCSPSCYSCLRNYYNQKIHDMLDRKKAYRFLESYSGKLTAHNLGRGPIV